MKKLNNCSIINKIIKNSLIKAVLNSINKLRQNRYSRLIRLDNLTGFWLLLLPVLWSVALSSTDTNQKIKYSFISIIGAFIMRSIGCIINDLLDRKYDIHVQRTKNRPLANGELSLKSAFSAIFILLSLALLLLMMLPIYTVKWAFIIALMICIYPLMKKYTHYAQVFLGIVFNSGVLLIWFAINPTPSLTPIIIYFSAIAWTVAYDTIYAYQDIEDDRLLELKSLALKLGDRSNRFLWSLYQLMMVSICIAALTKYIGILFFIGMSGLAYWIYPKVIKLDLTNQEQCAKFFSLNILYGFLILTFILIGINIRF